MGRLTQLRHVPSLQELIYGVARICEYAHSFIYIIRSLNPSLSHSESSRILPLYLSR